MKDATATAIYGARGANGVILITTKTGKKNSSSIEVDVKTGINAALIPRYDTMKSSNDYIGLAWESIYNQGNIRGLNPEQFANDNLFDGTRGIDPRYNSWNVDPDDVASLINPATRTVRPGVSRRYVPEYWGDFAFQPSLRQEANLKISGGGDRGKYYASVGVLDSKGYSLNSDFKRYSARLNITQDVNDWLTSNFNLGYAYSELNNNGQTEDSGSVFFLVDNMPAIYPLYERDANGNLIPDPVFGGSLFDIGRGRNFSGLTNGVADAANNIDKTDRHELNVNLSLEASITEDLTYKLQFGLQHHDRIYNSYNNPFFGSGLATEGYLYRRNGNSSTLNILNTLNYSKTFGDHTISALLAYEANSNDAGITDTQKQKVVLPGLLEFNNFIVNLPTSSSTTSTRLESYFSQVNYNFKNTYYLSASIRRDGSSRFVGDNKYDNFGSIGASWVLSNENFMSNQNAINFMKLKASYGIIGEQSGVGAFPGLVLYDVNNSNDNISLTESFVGNPLITWETSKMYQVGLESTFGNFLDVNIDYYIKDTENLLFTKRLNISSGVALRDVNEGIMRNSGLEFDISAKVIDNKDFKLGLALNGEFLNNELLELPIENATGEEKVIDIAGRFGRTSGRSLFDFYIPEWAGVDPSNGAPLWYTYFYDENGDGVFNESNEDELVSSEYEYRIENPGRELSRTVTSDYTKASSTFVNKSSIPVVRGGFRLNMNYKSWDLSTQFLYSLGGWAYDGAYAEMMQSSRVGSWNWHNDIKGRWQQPGDITGIPALTNNENNTSNPDRRITYSNVASTSTRFLTSTDYLTLNNVRLGYTIPAKHLKNTGISAFNIFLTGDNLFLLSKRTGFNPTISETGSAARYRYPPLTNITAGLRVKF